MINFVELGEILAEKSEDSISPDLSTLPLNCFLKSFLLNYQSVMEESMRVTAKLQGQGLLGGGKQSPHSSLGRAMV